MRTVFVFLLSLLFINSVSSQTNKDAIFITIGDQKITTGEFERIFNKNNSIATAEKQTVEEYLRMYINFRLKVQAAVDAGLDTTQAFRSELKGYRDQLARTYLTDNKAVDSLVMEAYRRMHTEVQASHIMAEIKINPTPSDTMEAWNKIMNIRQRLIKGENFETLAMELSEDRSAKVNQGNLGYFTAFQMVYPFESAAYNCKIGEFSQPVRTRFGYHIVKTTDKRPARGEVKVAHIMLMIPQGSPDSAWISAERKIKDIYQQLEAGADFSQLARERSQDRGSARNGGELPAFGIGRMVPEFEEAAFKLNFPGDISEPVRTFYGWHIIKLLEKKGIPDFEQVKQEIKSKITRDERAEYGSISFVNSLKKEYNFSENLNLLEQLFETEEPKMVASIGSKGGNTQSKSGSLSNRPTGYTPAVKKLKAALPEQKAGEVLFKFADQSGRLSEFYAYLKTLPFPDSSALAYGFVQKAYADYSKKAILDYENSILENKHEEFRYLISEYHDGILLFNLSDSMVWSKASADTSGLEKFFRDHQNDYYWPTRLEATVVNCNSAETATKAAKLAKKIKNRLTLAEEIKKAVCDTTTQEPCVNLEYNKFAKGDNQAVDTVKWKKGISPVLTINGKYFFVVVHNLLKPMPKSLSESKGAAISDYQSELDKIWVDQLRKKYEVTVNNDILNQLKAEYESKN